MPLLSSNQTTKFLQPLLLFLSLSLPSNQTRVLYIYSIRIYSISSHVFLNMILLRRKLPAKFQTPFSSRPKRRKNDVAPHHPLSLFLSLSLSLLKTMTPTPQPQNLSITTTLRPFSPLQICMHPHSITHTTIPSYLVLRVIIHIKAASIL